MLIKHYILVFFHSDIEAHLFNMINEYGKKNKEGKKTTTWAVTNIISTGVDISFNNIVINGYKCNIPKTGTITCS